MSPNINLVTRLVLSSSRDPRENWLILVGVPLTTVIHELTSSHGVYAGPV